jgi:hypothetical protein
MLMRTCSSRGGRKAKEKKEKAKRAVDTRKL